MAAASPFDRARFSTPIRSSGVFNFNNNMTSNCAGQAAGCSVNGSTGFDVASFMLGLVNSKNRNYFDEDTYTEKRPEYALYTQDDFRGEQL